MKTHVLKTINPYFQDTWDQKKLFEVRKNDRNFKVGDKIILREYDPKLKTYSRSIITTIIYILNDPDYCKKGYVIIQLKIIMEIHK